ncbi:hypothetical protein P3W85_15050 [Cupriavidus basilensis]|uniref:Uncharacterized protein n=1 Tax=Cupriavidus basilensis TaxID=68895 RepID=A0ABT6ANR3_9BURK|nr:hypothetical protein [Cupriavidus basilensis]MDF3834260.1 hypothetical protein [Cupriavidus basilensis]
MTSNEFASFKAHLAMLLRDLPAGTTADLTDVAVAYWDGTRVVGTYLRDGGRLDEEFDFDENAWENWRDEFVYWLAAPTFTERDELRTYLLGAVPGSGPPLARSAGYAGRR